MTLLETKNFNLRSDNDNDHLHHLFYCDREIGQIDYVPDRGYAVTLAQLTNGYSEGDDLSLPEYRDHYFNDLGIARRMIVNIAIDVILRRGFGDDLV